MERASAGAQKAMLTDGRAVATSGRVYWASSEKRQS